jgi:hypothetical protein
MPHVLHDQSTSKLPAVCLILLGLVLTPVLLGIPILVFGFYKLFK